MRKRVLASMLCMVLAVSAVGCGSSSASSESAESADEVMESVISETDGADDSTQTAETVVNSSEETQEQLSEVEYNSAGEDEPGEITWSYDESSYTLTISGSGRMEDYTGYSDENIPWASVRFATRHLVISEGITGIGSYAFSVFSFLIDAEIADSVSYIGEGAFVNCCDLEEIDISTNCELGAEVFLGCSCLSDEDGFVIVNNILFDCESNAEEVVITDGVNRISSDAFLGADDMVSVYIPDSVTAIESYAFDGCDSLTNVRLSSGLDKLESYTFSTCYHIEEITIPASVSYIEAGAFFQCIGLTSFYVEDGSPYYSSVDGVLYSADTKTLVLYPYGHGESYTIPDGVTAIGDYAFYRCDELYEITISKDVSAIGEMALSYSISTILIDPANTSFIIEEDTLYSADKTQLIRYLGNEETYNVPDGVIAIESGAFHTLPSYYSAIQEIILPESLETIGTYAFYGCDQLFDIVIPQGVTSIGNYAFYYCTSLVSISLPDGLLSIGDSAFSGCKNLSDIYYAGSQEEWDRISIGSGNDTLTSATIYFNS